jgi:signal transduction histidine kinase
MSGPPAAPSEAPLDATALSAADLLAAVPETQTQRDRPLPEPLELTSQDQSAQQFQPRLAELQVLYRMADSLGHARALNEIYDEAIDGLLGAVRADRGSILLLDDDGVMRFKAWRGLSDSYRAAVEGHSPWSRETRDPQPVTVPDVVGDPHLTALLPAITAEGIRALAFVPLVDDTGLVGKFMLYFDRQHLWTDAEVLLAQTIARHVSFAIARQRRDVLLRASVADQERLANEASEANRAKSVFLATMSHELRTPLNAIAGYTDLLDAGVHGELTLAQREAVQRIQANQRHLLRLIDDVLDFAKLEAGHLTLEMSDVPVQETLQSTRMLIEAQLRAKDITFEFASGDPLVTCRGDRAKIQQVLANLLSNAWKFTSPGGTVALGFETKEDVVRVYVRDTGPGIAAANLETIFAPFVQLQTGFRRVVEGTGLGLSISRELARAMGGEVTAASVIGEGSTFTLTLPRR